ncbi:Intradiol ring-cleavage dioxygenase [Aspergillus arachidicola]|uniref:Intradiol ring-cleavage dioxygenase n=1 Tax=Aspergillus arachidicola TaxID=656916 RepID=A0A5N6YBK8_9EURO|nr:Intradiol ring-cleavage dioxygenase [Aspergillus arachidicola]
MATCKPLPNVLLDLYYCNATGSYSSFTGLSPNTDFVELLSELNITDYDLGVTDLHTDDTTWLRGMWPTNENGVMEMKTVFPGFYTGRAIHIHVQVHTDWSVRENGTIIVSTTINRTTNAADSVFSQDTEGGYNPIVSIVPADGKDMTKGMIGYITIGVDTTAGPDPDIIASNNNLKLQICLGCVDSKEGVPTPVPTAVARSALLGDGRTLVLPLREHRIRYTGDNERKKRYDSSLHDVRE